MSEEPESSEKRHTNNVPQLIDELHRSQLRARAKAKLRSLSSDDPQVSAGDAPRLIEELQLHQIELEMQCEELQLSRKELLAQRDVYSALYNSSPFPQLTLDADNRITEINTSGITKLGAGIVSLEGYLFNDFVAKDSQDAYYFHRRSLVGRVNGSECEIVLCCADEHRFHALVHSVLQADRSTRMSIVDITERVDLEKEVEAKASKAEAASKAKSDFLANMSHELRTPMNGVIGLADILELTDLTNEQKEYLSRIKSCGRSLMNILGDILDVAAIEAGKFTIEEQPFCLQKILDSTISLFRNSAKEKGVKLTCDVAAETSSHLLGDPQRIKQIVANLVGNALKFTEEGSVGVRVSSEPAGEVCQVSFAVTDTGIGIPKHKQERIFESFEQADTSISKRYGGTGLGLNIVSKLVELMHGAITLESENGRGSSFTVTLPLKNIPADTPEASSHKKYPRKPELHILLVEDVPDNKMVMTKIAQQVSDNVDVVEDGEAALELLDHWIYDLVLMDIKLPGIDGLEVTRRIREHELTTGKERSVIIAVTAQALDGDKDRCLQSGMDDYLAKPVSLHEFRRVVDNHF